MNDPNKKRENAVRNLVNLYTVVIGVALSLAVRTLVDVDDGLGAITLASTMLFIAFISTLIPFYHGALRHLDDAYVENRGESFKQSALVIDFFLLFLHALAFVVLSLLLNVPPHFAWVLFILLGIDVVWGLFAHFSSTASRKELSAESKWTIINFVFVGTGVSYLVMQDIYLTSVIDAAKLSVPVAFACLVRTMVDYVWCRSFYFPH